MGNQSKKLKSFIRGSFFFLSVFYGMMMMAIFSGCKKEISMDEPSAAGMIYKPYGLEDLLDANVTTERQVVVLGMSQGKTYLIKTTKEGTVLWKKEVPIAADYPGNVETNSDGSILVFGITYEQIKAADLSVIKWSADGKMLKTTVIRLKENDPDFNYPIYSMDFRNLYAPDKEGGFYIQATLKEIYSFQVGFNEHLIHYNNKDSVDQFVSLNDAIPSRNFEIINGKNGKLNMLSVDISPLRLLLTQFDRSNYLNGKMVENFEEEIELIGEQIRSVTDENYAYTAQFKTEPGADFTEGMAISKADLNTGKKVDEWFIPLRIKNDHTYSIAFMSPQVGDDAVFFPLLAGNDAYIVQSSKDGKQHWVKNMSGNVSRDWLSKLLPIGDEILVFGKGSNNRGYETTLYMSKLDRDGNIISK